MAMEIHGIKLVGSIEDFKVENVTVDPTYTEAGHAWYNETEKKFKMTTIDAEGALVVRAFATDEDLQQVITEYTAEITRLEGLVSDEETRALAAEATLQANIASEVTRALAAEATLQANIDSEETRALAAEAGLQANIDSEETRALAAEAGLQSNIDTEKGRIDAILSASTADTDSFKEIVDLINSVDTENDEALAAQVLANNSRFTAVESDISGLQTDLATETQARIDAVSGLDSRVTTVEAQVNGKIGDLGTLTTDEVASLVGALNEIDSNVDQNASDLASEIARATAAEEANAAAIASEVTRASGAESALAGRLDVVEGSGEGSIAKAEADAKGYADSQISGLKAKVNAQKYAETTTVPATAHVITHNLNSSNVMFNVWVDRGDGVYRNDQVEVKIVDGNTIRVGDFGSDRNIKVVVQTVDSIA